MYQTRGKKVVRVILLYTLDEFRNPGRVMGLISILCCADDKVRNRVRES